MPRVGLTALGVAGSVAGRVAVAVVAAEEGVAAAVTVGQQQRKTQD